MIWTSESHSSFHIVSCVISVPDSSQSFLPSHSSPAMATAPRPDVGWPLRRFDLDSVSLNGGYSHFKDPQLVLKTQLDYAPRVPYTGSGVRSKSRSTSFTRRHLLMIHVKDKADELVCQIRS